MSEDLSFREGRHEKGGVYSSVLLGKLQKILPRVGQVAVMEDSGKKIKVWSEDTIVDGAQWSASITEEFPDTGRGMLRTLEIDYAAKVLSTECGVITIDQEKGAQSPDKNLSAEEEKLELSFNAGVSMISVQEFNNDIKDKDVDAFRIID